MEQKLYEAASGLPETTQSFDQVTETERLSKQKGPSRTLWRALAACLALALCLGFGIHAYRAEAQEYADALAFFQANGLSTEGLTRAEIKAVYKDISTKSFTYSKTGQVIQNSLTREQIEGFEIQLQEPTPEDLENLWDYKSYNLGFIPYDYPAYMIQTEAVFDATGTQIVEFKHYLERRDDENPVKLTYLPFGGGSICPVSDGIMILGTETYRDENNTLRRESWITKISCDGQILWIHKLENGFETEWACEVLENEDGSYTLFSCGDQAYLCVSHYSADGERTLYQKTPMDQISVLHAAHYDGGYLLQVAASEADEAVRFIRVDRQGNVTDGFSYYDGEYFYRIQDMVEYGGKVYVSAYTVPMPETFPELMGKPYFGLRNEVDQVYDKIHDYGRHWQDAPVAKLLRANYRAVLLVCDPKNGGKLETFNTVNGSLGKDLILTEDGDLIWETESIVDALYSPATSAYNIIGQCRVYQYFFHDDGKLYSMGKTDRVTGFHR